jgi:hypothetical protein
MPAGRHRADEHAVIGRVLLHTDAVAEEGSARERGRRIDRENRDGTARRTQVPDDLSGESRLSDAGRPGQSDGISAAGASEQRGGKIFETFGAILDHRDRPGDRTAVTRQHAVGEIHAGRVPAEHVRRFPAEAERDVGVGTRPLSGAGRSRAARWC